MAPTLRSESLDVSFIERDEVPLVPSQWMVFWDLDQTIRTPSGSAIHISTSPTPLAAAQSLGRSPCGSVIITQPRHGSVMARRTVSPTTIVRPIQPFSTQPASSLPVDTTMLVLSMGIALLRRRSKSTVRPSHQHKPELTKPPDADLVLQLRWHAKILDLDPLGRDEERPWGSTFASQIGI
jgi:hypothetical protein